MASGCRVGRSAGAASCPERRCRFAPNAVRCTRISSFRRAGSGLLPYVAPAAADVCRDRLESQSPPVIFRPSIDAPVAAPVLEFGRASVVPSGGLVRSREAILAVRGSGACAACRCRLRQALPVCGQVGRQAGFGSSERRQKRGSTVVGPPGAASRLEAEPAFGPAAGIADRVHGRCQGQAGPEVGASALGSHRASVEPALHDREKQRAEAGYVCARRSPQQQNRYPERQSRRQQFDRPADHAPIDSIDGPLGRPDHPSQAHCCKVELVAR